MMAEMMADGRKTQEDPHTTPAGGRKTMTKRSLASANVRSSTTISSSSSRPLSFALLSLLILTLTIKNYANFVTDTSLSVSPSSSSGASLFLGSSPNLQSHPKHQRPYVNDLLRRMNYRGSVDASRGGSHVHDLFRPDREAILFDGRTHPTHTVVIDVGAFDGMDIAFPAYQNGYTAVAFELETKAQTDIIKNWKQKGLVENEDFKVISVSKLVEQVMEQENENATNDAYHTMFLPLETSPIRLYLVKAGASSQTQRISVSGSGTTTKIETTSTAENNHKASFVVEIDRLVAPDTKVFLFKTDAEGHDGKALMGAKRLLTRRGGGVYSATLEFRPKSLREQGTDPVQLLQWLWEDCGFMCYDMNSHPGYEPQNITNEHRGLGRGSFIEDFVAWLDAVPLTKGPAGDELGGWEDLICNQYEL